MTAVTRICPRVPTSGLLLQKLENVDEEESGQQEGYNSWLLNPKKRSPAHETN